MHSQDSSTPQVQINGQSNGSAGGGNEIEQRSKFRQEEVVRLIVQELIALGYSSAARTLENESGFSLESPAVARFRNGVLLGDWGTVENLVSELKIEEEFVSTVLFLIAEQKYLELLEKRDIQTALEVLREELSQHSFDKRRLHRLSSLMMVGETEQLKKEIGWDGARGHSRGLLLAQLQKYIPPHVMIPERRLEMILEQSVTLQRLSCLYSNTDEDDDDFEVSVGNDGVLPFPKTLPSAEEQSSVDDHREQGLPLWLQRLGERDNEDDTLEARLLRIRSQIGGQCTNEAKPAPLVGTSNLAMRYPGPQPNHTSPCLINAGRSRQNYRSVSLYADRSCNRATLFPSVTLAVLEEHSDEVWSVTFSHSGQYLASASKDKTAIIWDIHSYTKLHTLSGHTDPVSYLAFSLDDKYILTCGNDYVIKMWDVAEGTCTLTIDKHKDPVTSCAWLPDHSFVSGSLDMHMYLWDVHGKELFKWTGARITDMDISADGKTLVVACHEKRIRIYNMEDKREIGRIQEADNITSLCLSKNARYALVNLGSCAVHLWDLHKTRLVRKYKGHQQGRFVIRSCLGGVKEAFVVSGSEDSFVYVWHRGQAELIEVLGGHTATVNSVTWNPKDPYMFASASDDHTVRLWGTVDRATGRRNGGAVGNANH